MVRVQVQLTGQQARALRARARFSERSISALVRESVDRFLSRESRPDRQELVRRACEVRGRFRSGVPDLAQDHDRYLADAMDP